MRRVVLDTSLTLKWCFNDEQGTVEALAVLTDVLNGRTIGLVPDLWLVESANALRSAHLRKRVTEDEAQRALQDLLEVPLIVISVDALITARALELALKHQRSVYDLVYVALAEREGVSLLTADRKLFDSLNPAGLPIGWFMDGKPETAPEPAE